MKLYPYTNRRVTHSVERGTIEKSSCMKAWCEILGEDIGTTMRNPIAIDEMQFGFSKGKGTTYYHLCGEANLQYQNNN